jgi:transposase, IS30 family
MAGAVLSAEEREEIRVGCAGGESFALMARTLGRSTSTVSEEVRRNGGRHRYCAVAAEKRAVKQRCRPKSTKFQSNRALADHVEDKLAALDSPTTIAIELARAGGISGDTVSAESIYQAVYGHGTRGLVAGLSHCLHRQRRRRKRRCRAGETPKRASPLGSFNLIGLRPEIAWERSEFGHFEGDLIIGERGRSAIVTLIDRASRYNLIGDLPEGHDATSVLACCIELIERLPEELRKTLTWDQGTEMARHPDLAAAVGIDVFFAEPHSPWMRPTNENFNGLLRRYVGKGTDLSIYSQQDLDRISHRINTMPRRIHQWESAADRYNAAVVALTT